MQARVTLSALAFGEAQVDAALGGAQHASKRNTANSNLDIARVPSLLVDTTLPRSSEENNFREAAVPRDVEIPLDLPAVESGT